MLHSECHETSRGSEAEMVYFLKCCSEETLKHTQISKFSFKKIKLY